MTKNWAEVGAAGLLLAEPLTEASFAAFGQPVTPGRGRGRPVNDGRAVRHDGVVDLARGEGARTPAFALYAVQTSEKPFAIDLLERHPFSSQTFVPMRVAGPYLVVVAPSDAGGAPDLARAQAFVANADVGVHYAPGVWHMPMAAFGADALFAMWMWEVAGEGNTEERRLPAPVFVEGW